MFKFIKSSSNQTNWYEHANGEVAFWGRSNVGKSSLINALTNNSKLAKVSKTPGRTQLINFFENEHGAVFVDLPGYGYAKISHQQKEQMMLMIEQYLINRKNLQNLFLLIDARHGLTKIDLQIINFLNIHKINFTIVYTKVDKLKQSEKSKLIKNNKEWTKTYQFENTYFVSSQTKFAIADLINFINSILGAENEKNIW
ncbi:MULTISPECIES: ribosome biogenesis GTP-binding protein YihA/YsxC [unclassified Mycoplasma]|uniref:ribosome biogenesis GTP-binding protein YihA/YsxC n=1 Tax=unclassified Mycoplasma TaxID=2683645 RepID=UPI00211C719C|nr:MULTISPECIES: ribosome biogenesis GTP-binding protein YihA/YsxC [unclassified Mycoplasma]UUM19927.1 ribosome biogenesis GTP-binding protein YihA/YsxC [Mycoplasma sp. 1578d]UUM24908.1 ribosome biogenesis GTP-binding protein YihA/YsxC [Mycoplasma sp. 3686d]